MNRIDILMTEKNIAKSRERAQKIIKEGSVYVDGKKVKKPSERYNSNVNIFVKENPLKYVGRGGFKLEKALIDFNLDVKNKIALDIGSSTGGFTDCLLQNGAKKVYAVDVGIDQLDDSLRKDDKVVVMEEMNIKDLTIEDIDDKVDLITIDVSFISLKIVLPLAFKFLKDNGYIVALIKPQFEAGRGNIRKNGIVRDKKIQREVILEISNIEGLHMADITYSPIKGNKGNIEFLGKFKKGFNNHIDMKKIENIVNAAHNNL